MSFKACRSCTSLNSAFPPPKMRGLINRCNSSIKPRFIKLVTRVAPPRTSMSLAGCCFILRISSTSRTIRVVFHANRHCRPYLCEYHSDAWGVPVFGANLSSKVVDQVSFIEYDESLNQELLLTLYILNFTT